MIDGVDIQQHDIQQLRSKITVIAQDPTLFTGTLKFNLDPFNEFSVAAIEELLLKAGLTDLINREPEQEDPDLAANHMMHTEVTS